MATKSRRAILIEEARAAEAAYEMEAFNKKRNQRTTVAVKEKPDPVDEGRQPKSKFVRRISQLPFGRN